MVRNWFKVWRLSAAERSALVQALVLLPLTALALRIVGFNRFQRALARLAGATANPAARNETADLMHARALARMVEAAARCGAYRAKCLTRSLTLCYLLRRRGIDGDLRIGVRKERDRLHAHAWVELRGVVLNDGADVHERFAAFDRGTLAAGVA
jgi:Transglutaminase-like superfamily